MYFSGDATVEGSELSITSKKTTETDTSGKESCNMVYSGEGTMRLELQNDGKIKYTDGNKNMKTGIDIGYRPTSAATAYPGDDLIPGFKAVYSYDKKSLDGFVFDEEKNYIAVYDKKLLWRANLYIDEGDGDWNNAHPWNAPADSSVESAMVTAKTLPVWWSNDWGYNEWNKSETAGGGQIPIARWTCFQSGSTDNVASVAYGWGAWDGASDFNSELEEQRNEIKRYREAETAKKDSGKEYDSVYMGAAWTDSQTTAPGGDWSNYMFPEKWKVNDSNRVLKDKKICIPGLSVTVN